MKKKKAYYTLIGSIFDNSTKLPIFNASINF
jgi:hypothetical protein